MNRYPKMRVVVAACVCLVSCSPIRHSGKEYRTARSFWLTTSAYNPPEYPCDLSDRELIGSGGKYVKRLGLLPKGELISVDEMHVKKDFYSPDRLEFRGQVRYAGERIGYIASFSEDEFAKWFIEVSQGSDLESVSQQ